MQRYIFSFFTSGIGRKYYIFDSFIVLQLFYFISKGNLSAKGKNESMKTKAKKKKQQTVIPTA